MGTSPGDDISLDFCQKFLQGYKPLEWPDLSAERLPCNSLYSTPTQFVQNEVTDDLDALVLVTLGRILGAYCSASDILLGTQTDLRDSLNLVRVTWSEGQSWNDVIATVGQKLRRSADEPRITLATVRRALDFSDKQMPCLALYRSSPGEEGAPVNYPFALSFDPSSRAFFITSSTTSLHPSFASLLLSQFTTLFDHALDHLTMPIVYLPELSHTLMSVSERTTSENLVNIYPHMSPVRITTDYLGQRARSFPDSIAVRWYPDLSQDSSSPDFEFESITYADLHRGANKLARWLIAKGLEKEDRVAVCMNRNLMFHVVMMGIMRAGGCYVPIDPELPLERKRYIALDSIARFVVTSEDISSSSFFGAATVIIEDEVNQQAIRDQNDGDLDIATPDALAFLLYTSGTTGTPKGCLLTHEGLAQAIWALSSTAAQVWMDDLTQGRYLAVASIAFDVHLAETMVPIALGMPLFSAPRSLLLENLPFYIKKLGVTHVGIVPSLIEATMGAVQEEEGENGMMLRYIASGGEKMSDSILEKWANHPKVRLANFYGPSEVTIGCCARFMDSTTSRSNIGRTFGNVSGYVVDENLKILLRGSIGELVVEGPLVGRGYHGRPDLTEKVFLEWPQKGRWAYRTGDLVRMMPDSTLEILGRIDTQIKLRGVRIESEGISSIIRKAMSPSPDFTLDATTVLAKHPAIGAEQLVSFIAWDSSVSISTRKSSTPHVVAPPKRLLEKIREICAIELASYMRPSHLIPLSWLPLSSNGKADAKVLVGIFSALEVDVLTELMAQDKIGAEIGQQLPPTELEQQVLAVVAKHTTISTALYHPQINLFECGMDSMAVIRFAADIKATFGQRISASEIMKTPTIGAIASILERGSSVEAPELRHSYVKGFSSEWTSEVQNVYPSGHIEDILPPFSVQEGVLSRSAHSTTMYVQHITLNCRSSTSLSKLMKAWESVMSRHAILRTVFLFSKSLVQVVLHPNARELPWDEKQTSITDGLSFSQWFLCNEAAAVARSVNEDISRVPPFRINVYVSSGVVYKVLSIHHALFDGISLPILLQDVEREYLGNPPQPTAVLADLLDQIAAIDLSKAREFWKKYFSGFNWPTTLGRSASSDQAKSVVLPFKTPLSSLKALATANQVTLQALLTCTFAHLLATRLYNREDIVFGVIRSGRLLPVDAIDVAICPMISVLPTRVDFRNYDNILHNIQRDISDVVEFEHVSLSKIQNWIRPGKPIFETLFSVSIKENTESQIWDIIESEPPQPDFIFAVEVVLNPAQDSLVVQAAWVEQDLSEEFVNDFVHNFEGNALEIGEGRGSHSLISIESDFTLCTSDLEQRDLDEDSEPEGYEVLDANLLTLLRTTIADFLDVNESLVTETTSFIALGLDSIKSVGLSRTLREGGIEVSAVQLMKKSTLRRLVYHITSTRSSEVELKADETNISFSHLLDKMSAELDLNSIKLRPDDQVQVFPATILQAGMLSQTISSHGRLYVHAFPVRLKGVVDADQLRDAWKRAAQLISILRTSFHFLSDLGIWAQVVHSSVNFDWTTETYQSVDDYDEKLSTFISSFQLISETDFEQPPFRVRLFHAVPQSPEQGPRLVLVMHHALYDGLSVGKLFDAVKAIYRSQNIEPLTQFTDLLGHFTRQEQTGTSFWVRRLRDYHHIALSHQPSSERLVTSHAASHIITLDPIYLEKATRLAAVTVQCLGQAAWAKSIGILTRSTDIVFGHVVSGRSIPGAEDVIGPVLNTIPCRVRLQKGTANVELLKSVHRANVAALPWQQASLRAIQKDLGVPSLWDSIFLFQPLESTKSDPEPLWEFEVPEEDAKIQYPINIEMHQQESGFVIKAACRSDFMSATDLTTVLKRFHHFLDNIITRPDDDTLKDVPELSDVINGVQTQPTKEEQGMSSLNRNRIRRVPDVLQNLLASVTRLNLDRITFETPLAALGIDSITAIQIVAKCRKEGIHLIASEVVGSRTVGDLIGRIDVTSDNQMSVEGEQADIDVPADEKAGVYARFGVSEAESIESVTVASPGMKWLIGAWQRSERSRFQHAFAYRLPDEVDTARLQDAWTALLSRHAILRSTFACARRNAEPRIVTFKPNTYGRHWAEQYFPHRVFFRSMLAKMKELVASPPSTNEPPSKALLIHSSRHRYLILYFHHFQYDAWSLQLLVDDLSRLYHGQEPASSNDIATFLRASATNPGQFVEQQRYWQAALPPPLQFVLFPSILNESDATLRPQQRTIYTATTLLHASLCEERARTLHVSLQAVFLACWARLQTQYTSNDSSTFGLWQAGRTAPIVDIARLAVPCMNVLPLHVPGANRCDIIDIAKKIQEDLRSRSAVIEQSDLVKIDEWVGGGGKPLCNVFVNIVKIAPDIKEQSTLLEPVNVPYFTPDVPPLDSGSTIDKLPVTSLIQDDLMIDIATIPSQNTILMSIDSAAHIMNLDQAKILVDRWASITQGALELS